MDSSSSLFNRDLVRSAAGAAGAFAHSVRYRGFRRSVIFAALSLGLPALGEHHAVRVQRSLRHHMQPQVRGIPLAALFGWYGITYATYALVGSMLESRKRSGRPLPGSGPVWTALFATDLDLLLDAYGLDRGLWEWRDGGPYAAELKGANGQSGVPWENFAGWIVLTGGVTALYERFAGDPVEARSAAAGRAAAVLLLPYYLLPALWALQEQKRRKYLFFANPFAAAVLKGLRG